MTTSASSAPQMSLGKSIQVLLWHVLTYPKRWFSKHWRYRYQVLLKKHQSLQLDFVAYQRQLRDAYQHNQELSKQLTKVHNLIVAHQWASPAHPDHCPSCLAPKSGGMHTNTCFFTQYGNLAVPEEDIRTVAKFKQTYSQ